MLFSSINSKGCQGNQILYNYLYVELLRDREDLLDKGSLRFLDLAKAFDTVPIL